jgi:hypothetical protein
MNTNTTRMRNVEDLNQNEVIHCPTEREAIAICYLMDRANMRWSSGVNFLEITNWDEFKEQTCYRPFVQQYGELASYMDTKKTIYPASDFLPLEFYAEVSSQVENPSHYGGKENPYEAIKVIEAWGLGFHLGNVVKYISRAGKKSKNTEKQDIEKALWYISRYLERLD